MVHLEGSLGMLSCPDQFHPILKSCNQSSKPNQLLRKLGWGQWRLWTSPSVLSHLLLLLLAFVFPPLQLELCLHPFSFLQQRFFLILCAAFYRPLAFAFALLFPLLPIFVFFLKPLVSSQLLSPVTPSDFKLTLPLFFIAQPFCFNRLRFCFWFYWKVLLVTVRVDQKLSCHPWDLLQFAQILPY